MATKIPPIANTLVNLNLVSQEDITPLANQHGYTAEFLKAEFIGVNEHLSTFLTTYLGKKNLMQRSLTSSLLLSLQ